MRATTIALLAAAVIGIVVAVIHGVLTQRLMVVPFERAFRDDARMAPAIKRLVPLMLHLSTVSWFLGGAALFIAALWFDHSARLVTSVGVAALYLYGALSNLWGTRSLHPGWILYVVAVALIAFAIID